MPTLVLASASPARLATLRSNGIEPLVIVSEVDEDAALERAAAAAGRPLGVAEQVAELARAKAEAVATDRRAAGADLVLGCDSLLELDGVAMGKPHDAATATARWKQMRGRAGTLHTGHHLISADGRVATGVSSTTVWFADLTDAEIAAYVATGEPLEVAGAFTIDGLGGAFVTAVEGDHHGVVGLSLPLARTLARRLDVEWTDLWHPSTM